MKIKKFSVSLALLAFMLSFSHLFGQNESESYNDSSEDSPYIIVLGTIQDAGAPHVACEKACCKVLFEKPDPDKMVASLGLVDPTSESRYLFDATPDFVRQLRLLQNTAPFPSTDTPDGIFLTHAHIGHYTGLMYLGKEAMDSKNIPVYAMPRMADFLSKNGPWDQLINRKNVKLNILQADQPVRLNDNLAITPVPVPHRDEYSETVGYIIQGPAKKALFIPDIDKWNKWSRDLPEVLKSVDYAFLDATFFDAKELPGREMSEIPHPSIRETMELLKGLDKREKAKVNFIHLNHTNPALAPGSAARKLILDKGFHLAETGQIYKL